LVTDALSLKVLASKRARCLPLAVLSPLVDSSQPN